MSIRACTPHLRGRSRGTTPAFTLVELLLALALLIIIVGVVFQITNQTSQIWRDSENRIQAFQEARAGFEAMTRRLSQTTLNTYYDYYDSTGRSRLELTGANLAAFTPATYDRISDLHFVSGHASTLLKDSPKALVTQTHAVFFQAPLGYSSTYRGLDNALNACGYFLQFDDSDAAIPDHIRKAPGYQPRPRFRLKEMTLRTERLAIYDRKAAGPNAWFTSAAATSGRNLAENVIALVILPKLSPHEDDPAGTGKGVSIAPLYNYNSRVPLGATSDPAWKGAVPPFPPDKFTAHPPGKVSLKASRHHQLPPILRVAMVVLDETSAARLQGSARTLPPAINLAATNLFTDAARMDADLAALADICNAKPGNQTGNTQRLTHRIFSTEIILREAKWSTN